MFSLNSQLSTVILTPDCNERLKNLCGPCNEHLNTLETRFNVKISQQQNRFDIVGPNALTPALGKLLKTLYQHANQPITHEDLNRLMTDNISSKLTIRTSNKLLYARTDTQNQFIDKLSKKALNFAIGPAGTGKTYLSVAKSIESLELAKVERLVFVRPAVDAGEKLGFLPGDMVDKVLPYLRPIYDALYEMMGVDRVQKLIRQDIIEIAPLAFMRGRTLNNAFILLDEAQNTTNSQMKMFLTRMGHGSQIVVNGDITQTDLPANVSSGLSHAVKLVGGLKDVGVTYFNAKDVVRHALVQDIICAYEKKQDKK